MGPRNFKQGCISQGSQYYTSTDRLQPHQAIDMLGVGINIDKRQAREIETVPTHT